MSGLGHILEQEGLPSVQISLVREHSEKMRAARALWVPFILGRPLGVPHDPAFQKRVLRAALRLLQAPSGPVIKDFPEDAPAGGDMTETVCPVSFGGLDEDAGIAERLRREVQQLRVWYDLGHQRRGRTTYGVSGLEIEMVAAYLAAVAEGEKPESPRPELSLDRMLKLACDDLKAFYYEAFMAQPGQATPEDLDAWFWQESEAGALVVALWRMCRVASESSLQRLARVLVPHAQLKRLKLSSDH